MSKREHVEKRDAKIRAVRAALGCLDPDEHGTLVQRIEQEIREAVAEENEKCVKLVEAARTSCGLACGDTLRRLAVEMRSRRGGK